MKPRLRFTWSFGQCFGLGLQVTWWSDHLELFGLIGPLRFHVEHR